MAKSVRAIKQTGYESLVVAGGVGANRRLRKSLTETLGAAGSRVYFPRPALCTDNGAMVAHAGLLRLKAGHVSNGEVMAQARWELETLPAM